MPIPEAYAEKLFSGQLTMAEFFGLSEDTLYEIAQMANGLLASGQAAQARKLYEGLVAASPFDSYFHSELASALHALEENDLALAHYVEALTMNPANIDARVGKGELLIRRNRMDEGVADLKAALELDPNTERPSTQRARATLERLAPR